jgi:hypothetical protein
MFFLHNAMRFGIAAVVIVAVELTISWNNIQGVYSAGPAGQLIPTVIGIGTFLRVIYIWFTSTSGPGVITVTSGGKQLESGGAEPPPWNPPLVPVEGDERH